MRYIVAVISFLFVFLGVAIICGIIMAMIFPPEGRTALVGIGLDWRNAPGTILGLLAGIQSARASLRAGKKKKENDRKT